MSNATIHIAEWEAAGLIDHETADRLRVATVTSTDDAVTTGHAPARSGAGELFGPSVTIPEVFGYLGTGFLLGAWTAWTGRASIDGGIVTGIMALVAAFALVGLGAFLRRGDERASRAAGVAFLASTAYVGFGAASLAGSAHASNAAQLVVAGLAALVAGSVLRRFHPSVLTQAAVLGSIVVLAQAVLALLDEQVFHLASGEPGSGAGSPLTLIVLSAAFWLVIAVGIALLGLREAQAGDRSGDRAAYRRAAITRFWAGITAVVGLATAVTRTGTLPNGEWGRFLEPIVGELALVVLAAVLVERAFRRNATSFMYAAALALIVALTDFNISYLAGSTEIALLVEGLILLGVGLAANQLRGRIGSGSDGRDAPDGGPAAAPADPPASEPAPGG